MAAAKKSSSKKKSFLVLIKNNKKSGLIGAGIFLTVLFLFFVFLILLPPPFYEQGFENFAELNAYAQSTVELVPLESENAVKPDFKTYYAQFKPGILNSVSTSLSRIAVALGFQDRPVFSPGFFKTVVETILKRRMEKGYKKKCIDKLKVGPNAECIVWGDLQGALHSLTYDLNKIKELGYLDESFKLIKPNTYIIFLGNIVNRTPYTLETLSLVLRLLERNPDRVLYTKGSHETDGYWLEHTLKTEMKLRLTHISDQKVPMKKEVMDLFDTVTLVSYLQAQDNNGNCFVRLSRLDRQNFLDQHFAKFLLDSTSDSLSVFNWQTKGVPELDPSQPEVMVKAVMKIEKKRETYQPTEGLRMMEPDMGATAWTLISCPTPAYEKALKFYNDTFAILSTAQQMDQWTIELYYQDRRDRSGFKTKKYNFMSGREVTGVAQPASQEQQPLQDQPAQLVTPQQESVTKPVQPTAATPVQQAVQPAAQSVAAAPAQQVAQPVAQSAEALTQQPAVQPIQTQPVQQVTPQAPATKQVQSVAVTPVQQAVQPTAQPVVATSSQQVAQPVTQATVAPAQQPAVQPIVEVSQVEQVQQTQGQENIQQSGAEQPVAQSVEVLTQQPAVQPIQTQPVQQVMPQVPATKQVQPAAAKPVQQVVQPTAQQTVATSVQQVAQPVTQATVVSTQQPAVQPIVEVSQVEQAQQTQEQENIQQSVAEQPVAQAQQPLAQAQPVQQKPAPPIQQPITAPSSTGGLQPAPPGM